jgi:ribosomal protein S18 acetylase RimI-like enzyme
MSDITYTTVNEADLDRLAPLWLKLRDHHMEVSAHFRHHFAGVTWVQRHQELVRKATGGLHAEFARDGGTLIGYCIASVNGDGIGEIESIYVDPAYRGRGLGATLMERALAWFKDREVKRTILGIGEGNESVIGFYRRFGFEVRTTIMERPFTNGA